MAFQRGEVASETMLVNNEEVMGIEVIDTKIDRKPAPINVIMFYCNTIDEIKKDADIWTVKNNLPKYLENLLEAVREYCIEFNMPNALPTIDIIEELILGFRSADNMMPEQKRKDMIREAKEVVSFQISRLINLS
jgi:hypothetical protein